MKVPAITSNPPNTNNTIKPKKSGVFTMASADGRSSVNGVVPQNPVVPRIRAAAGSAATQRTATTTNANPSSSSLLHPARSPKSLSRKTRAESVASPDPYYNHSLNPRHHVVRPSSAASNRSFVPGGGSAVGTGRLSRTGRDSPMFFHASEAGHPAPAPQPTHTAAPYVASSGPKFFHADGASVDSTAEPPLRVARAPRVLSASPQIGANGPILAASPSRNMNISPPSSRPASMVGYPASPRPASVAMGNPRTPSLAPAMAENRSRAGFVYANGTEELLQPRKPSGSEIGSATTSPQLPSSPKFGNANPSPKVSYPFSPLASPGLSSPPHYFQRHVSGSSSRRASIDLKSRHGRNASISSVIDLSALKKEEIGHADDEGHSGSGGTGSEEDPEDLEESSAEDEYVPPPPPMPLPGPPVMGMTAAERIKLMEERSANSRRERKVMDLEISNASLLAINKTLEKEMRRQTAELRRYKRLARSGRLSSGASNNNPRSSSPASKRGKSDSDAASIVESEEWEANGSEEDDDTETEKLSEEEGESEDEDGKSDEKHREADEKRLTLDLSKHQALLDASSKMNKSLRGCLLITDQLIREGKKALEYRVRASDVRERTRKSLIITVTMSSSSAIATVTTTVFEAGKYTTVLQKVESRTTCCTAKTSPPLPVPPPKPLLIVMPCEAGEFPLLVFLHGYLLYNSFYSQLLQHIASHGFIVIAPQLYLVAGQDSSDEIKSVAATTNWLSEGLHHLLPPHVKPNLSKLGLAGHSRGGKTAFALALEKAATTLKFSALIGVDPVDGMGKGKQTPPPVLTYVPHSFDLDMAIMVIGSGLGELKKNPLFPPCAPEGVNHKDFFKECKGPASYFVVKDYGHLDMLDDDTEGIRGKTTYCLCKNGKSREPMRKFIGGVVVAFMKAYLGGDTSDLMAIKGGQTGPVELQTVEYIL